MISREDAEHRVRAAVQWRGSGGAGTVPSAADIPTGKLALDERMGPRGESNVPVPGDDIRLMPAAALVQSFEEALRPLSQARNVAWWDSQVDASEENERRRAESELSYSDALSDPEVFAAVGKARRADGDPLVHRQLDLMRHLMLPHQVPNALRARIVELESAVEARFSRHRGVVQGVEVDDNEIKRILRESDDPAERREAWEAAKTVGGAVADDVRELARLRNEAARALGYRDWFALSLSTDEFDEGKLLATLAEADRVTVEPFTRWKNDLDQRLARRFGCSTSELRPWHYADPFFQETPVEGAVDLDPLFSETDVVSLSRRTFDGIGLEVAGILGEPLSKEIIGITSTGLMTRRRTWLC